MSALPLRPFGVPDMVWPQGMCEVCYQPQWSDALHDWEFVEDAAGPCGTCQLLQVVLTDLAPRADAREGSR
jgi:hypothetical protein